MSMPHHYKVRLHSLIDGDQLSPQVVQLMEQGMGGLHHVQDMGTGHLHVWWLEPVW
jgi:hypothetical protein